MITNSTLPPLQAQPPIIEPITTEPVAVLERLVPRIRLLQDEIGKVIIGQQEIISAALYALFARGHCLLVGVPGLAKTLLVHSLARSLELSFSRIQFTPDLMPSDINRHRNPGGGYRDGSSKVCFYARSSLHPGAAGR